MQSTHKINVGKNDEATLVAEKIIDTGASAIVLNVPRFAKISESPANFKLLKREAEALNKKLLIESVDDKVIALCKQIGLESVNPFFEAPDNRRLSDIVLSKNKKSARLAPKGMAKNKEQSHPAKEKISEEEGPAIINFNESQTVESDRKLKKTNRRKPIYLTASALTITILIYLALFVLPRAEIKLKSARLDWSFNNTALADKNLTVSDFPSNKIPGQLFSYQKNIQLSFPATARRKVEQKATGKIIVFNGYSSSPQILVAATRFAAPDGMIFRLTDKLIIPGAKISDGKIQPSSVVARVIADQAGSAYNVGPIAKLTIPGFAGTPKFSAFYAELKDPLQGGFIGDVAAPTETDLKNAKDTAAKTLESSLKTLMLAQLPGELKLIDGASQFRIVKQTIDAIIDASGKFSVFTEGALAFMAFKESDLLDLLSEKISKDKGSDFEIKSHALSYGQSKFNPTNGQLSITVNYQGILAKKIDGETLKNKLSGKSEFEIKALLFSVSGLESAQVSLWPFWVRRVPNAGKIKLTVD